jgi:hypothetical protein
MQVPKAHIHPLGENSPNLVTLVPSNGSSVKRKTTKMYQTGLPDGIGIWIPKIPIWKWLWNRKYWFILNPLVYFKAIGIHILLSFGIYFPVLFPENPVQNLPNINP